MHTTDTRQLPAGDHNHDAHLGHNLTDDHAMTNEGQPMNMTPEPTGVDATSHPHLSDETPDLDQAAEAADSVAYVADDPIGLNDAESSAAQLPQVLAAAVLQRGPSAKRHKKHTMEDEQRGPQAHQVVAEGASGGTDAGSADAQGAEGAALTIADLPGPEPTTEFEVDLDDPHWRIKWPTNLVIVRGLIEPSLAQSPTADSVNRIRTTILVTEIDPDTPEQVGLVARIPVLVLPLAHGYGSIANEVSAARRKKQPGQRVRIEPVMVEARGISKRIEDRDTRFAEPRRTNLMAVEISSVRRIHKGSEQLSFWRGRGTVVSHRPFNLGDREFLRVTLKVPSARHRSYLRGPALNEDPVDVLVQKDHPHYERFRRIGQTLLVEAQVTSQTNTLRDDHPSLDGVEEDVKRRIQTLRQPLVIATMGEFPNDQAETDFNAWVEAGAPVSQPRMRNHNDRRTAGVRDRSRGHSSSELNAVGVRDTVIG